MPCYGQICNTTVIRRFFEQTWHHLINLCSRIGDFIRNSQQWILNCLASISSLMVSRFRRVSKSRQIIFLVNIVMLLLALWMIGDQVFDGLQSYTYFIYSQFWNKKWHHQDKANSTISRGTNVTHCDEASLAECWDYIHTTMAYHTESVILEAPCGKWNTATQTITLNCKLRLNEAYFACSLVCWFLPPIAFGSLLTFMKYKVRAYH